MTIYIVSNNYVDDDVAQFPPKFVVIFQEALIRPLQQL